MFCWCFIQQFHSELNIFQCWKRIDISWMIVGNYTCCTKSDFYEIVNVITNFLGQLLSVKCDFWLAWLGCGMAWTRKVWTVLMELPETQQLLCTHFLLCLLSDTEAVYQKFTTDLHIYWPLPKTQESDFCRAL